MRFSQKNSFDKILCVKAFSIAKNSKYDGYQCGLASMVYKIFDEKTSGSGIKNENMSDQQLAEELHNPIIRKLIKEKYNHLLQAILEAQIQEICN